MAAISWDSWRRRRWLPPLIALAALCLASLAVAFVTTRGHGSGGHWLDEVAGTLSNVQHAPRPITVAPEPPTRPSVNVTSVTSSATASAPTTIASEDDATLDVARAPLAYPPPIVLHVEPPIELDDGGARIAATAEAGSVTAGVASAASASAVPVASAAPSASAAPPVVTCGSTQCAPGKVCCNASCGTCVDPGERCSQRMCGMGMTGLNESQSCGSATCNVGEICCNASCGTCIRPGDACDATRRCSSEITFPDSQSCGMQTCNVGLDCCNPSCGICAPPGEPCSHDVCR